MAKYSALLGRRIEVTYRAGDLFLPATGTLVADSGRSIFLEERFCQRGTVKNFRWEIPYQCIVKLEEAAEPAPVSEPAESPAKETRAEESASAGILPLKNHPKET